MANCLKIIPADKTQQIVFKVKPSNIGEITTLISLDALKTLSIKDADVQQVDDQKKLNNYQVQQPPIKKRKGNHGVIIDNDSDSQSDDTAE